MAQQSKGGFGVAHPVSYSPQEEKKEPKKEKEES